MIRSTFYAFETAKRALTNSQLGLDTVGHNISNINTIGYTRQRVDQVSMKTTVSASKYVAFGYQVAGQGSLSTGISNIRDPYLDRRYRNEAAQAGEYNALSSGMADINAIFDELMQNGSHAKIGEFLDQLEKLIGSADSKEMANVLRNKAEQLCQVINTNYTQLISVRQQQNDDLQYAINDVNGILEQIAILNAKIKEANLYGNPANELCDDRNVLIDQLSEFIDIEVKNVPKTLPDGYVVSELQIYIKNSGDADKGIDPVMLVDNADWGGLKLETKADGTVAIHYADATNDMEIKLLQPDGTYSSDITSKFQTGILTGHLKVLNGLGVHAANGEQTYRGIPYYISVLDDYANRFAEVMNEFNQLKIYGPNGELGYISRDLFVPSDDSGVITAANISVSEYWTSNPMFIETAAKNNALYTDPLTGELCYYDDSGTPVSTGILWSAVDSNQNNTKIDALGYLLEESSPGNWTRVQDNSGNDINVNDLQRAITVDDFEEISMKLKYFADSNDRLVFTINGDTITTNGGSTVGSDGYWGAAGQDLTISDIAGVDDDGYFVDSNGVRIMITYTDSSNVTHTIPLRFEDLDQQAPYPNREQGYLIGDPTPNELLPGKSANDNLLNLKIALKEERVFENGFQGNFQEYLVSMQSDMSLDKQNADTKLSASITVLTGLANQRDGISAVSIDEEGINMMTYQNYYNAAARYMTVLDEALGTIIQSMGVVGR